MKLFRNHIGDTIVEVLIAMAVASAVLGSSYTLVSRTMANARQAQEHGEALQLANRQVENIIALLAQPGAAEVYDNTPVYKCTDKTTGQRVDQPLLTAAGFGQNANLATAGYAAGCVSGTTVQYYVAYTYANAATPSGNLSYYKVTVTWVGATGRGNDQVSIVYRAYQP